MTFLSSKLVQRSQWKGSKAERMVRPMRCRWLQQGGGKQANNRGRGMTNRRACCFKKAAARNENSPPALCCRPSACPT
jgi:hypothetical protein